MLCSLWNKDHASFITEATLIEIVVYMFDDNHDFARGFWSAVRSYVVLHLIF